MTRDSFSSFSDGARLWVFAFNRSLSVEDRKRVSRQLEAFLPQWASHKVPVHGAYAILEDRIALVAGECPDGLSGCSMDSCLNNFKTLKAVHGLDALDRGLIFFRGKTGVIESCQRIAFQKKAEAGEITPHTPVIDTTLQTLGQLRRGELEKPFLNSWHSQAFRLPEGSPVPS